MSLNAHRRLLVALALFIVSMAALPGSLSAALRIAMSWDLAVVVFLFLTGWMIERSPKKTIRQTVLGNDQGKVGVLLLVLFASGASVAAIFFLLQQSGGSDGPSALQVAFAIATIVCSWLLTHVMFALHYAHRFYRDDPSTAENDATGGLSFPGTPEPTYWDFLYFSFVIGMTSQVSDVQVTSSAMRKLVAWHGILSFAFYTIVLALSINIVAGLV